MNEGIVRLWVSEDENGFSDVKMEVLTQNKIRMFEHDPYITFTQSPREDVLPVISTTMPGLHSNNICVRGTNRFLDNLVALRLFKTKREAIRYYEKVKRSLEAAGFEVAGEEEPHKEEIK